MKAEEHIVEGVSGEYSRKIWLLNAVHPYPEKIGIFLDGEFYVNKMDGPSTLLRLQQDEVISPMTCVFVSHVDGKARHEDLTCNPRYSDFIAIDIIHWLRDKVPSLPERGHLVAGASLGGLAATYITLSRPKLFPYCLSHSGSFWWNSEWLKKHLDQMPRSQSKFWLSVGSKEIDSSISHPPTGLRQDVTQISACERLVTTLRNRGHSAHYNLYTGGHDFEPWKDELPTALRWLLG